MQGCVADPLNSDYTILWTNTDQLNTFAPQDITVPDMSGFSRLEIMSRIVNNINAYHSSLAHVGSDIWLIGGNGTSALAQRIITYSSPTVLSVGATRVTANGSGTINNAYCIPTQIIGYK